MSIPCSSAKGFNAYPGFRTGEDRMLLTRHGVDAYATLRRLRRPEDQRSSEAGSALGIVARMALAVVHWHLQEIERRNALDAGAIDPELVGVRAAPVVRVNTARRAEMMLRD